MNKILAGRKSPGIGFQLMWAYGFSYGANGKRMSKKTGWGAISSTYDSEDELLTAGKSSYRHDRNGRLIQETDADGITSYTYDSCGRTVKADSAMKGERKTIEYAYDALGRRTIR